ncbi:Y-e3.2 family protein [Megaselia abdita]
MCKVHLNHYYLFQDQNPPEIYNVTTPIDRTPLQALMDYSNPEYPRTYLTFPLPLTPSGRSTASLAVSSNRNPIIDGYFVPVLQENHKLCSIISIYEDRCGRLWILDSGLETLDTFKCPPKIVIMDKNSEKILEYYEFPSEYFKPASRMIQMVVDENFKNCRDFKAIISDAVKEHLIVYEPARERSWIVTSYRFRKQSIFENIQYENITFSFPVGVYSIALTPPSKKNGARFLVFTVFSGNEIHSVQTTVLYDYRLWTEGFSTRKLKYKDNDNLFTKIVKKFSHQEIEPEFVNVQKYFFSVGKTDVQIIGTCDIDENWIMYCGVMGGVTAINVKRGSAGNILIVKNDEMDYVSDVRIVKNPQGEEELFALKNSMLKILGKPFDATNMNYGYYGCKLNEIYDGDEVKCNPHICAIR